MFSKWYDRPRRPVRNPQGTYLVKDATTDQVIAQGDMETADAYAAGFGNCYVEEIKNLEGRI